jgi:hypothetical protein
MLRLSVGDFTIALDSLACSSRDESAASVWVDCHFGDSETTLFLTTLGDRSFSARTPASLEGKQRVFEDLVSETPWADLISRTRIGWGSSSSVQYTGAGFVFATEDYAAAQRYRFATKKVLYRLLPTTTGMIAIAAVGDFDVFTVHDAAGFKSETRRFPETILAIIESFKSRGSDISIY